MHQTYTSPGTYTRCIHHSIIGLSYRPGCWLCGVHSKVAYGTNTSTIQLQKLIDPRLPGFCVAWSLSVVDSGPAPGRQLGPGCCAHAVC